MLRSQGNALAAPRAALLAAAVFSLAGATGCVQKPVVHIDHAEITSASLQGVGMIVVLRITNPNSFDVTVRHVRGTVTINGHYQMPPIDITGNQVLPSHQTTNVAVQTFVPISYVPGLIAESAGSPSIRYHVTGSADVSATKALDIEVDDYPVDEDGFIPREVFVGAARSILPF